MKYSGKNFRDFYKQIVAIEMSEDIRKVIADFPGAKSANCVYAYGYIDHDAGFMFEVLASGKQGEKSGLYNPREGNNDISIKLKADMVEGLEIVFFSERTSYRKKFAEKIEMIEGFNVSDEINETRSFSFLDYSRDEYLIDDVMVYLVKEGRQPEKCWVRIEGLDSVNHVIIGRLLNEPAQNFGYHAGEIIEFFMQEIEDKNVICVSNMNNIAKISREDLEDGKMLEEAVHRFNSERTEQNLFDVLEILRDSYVWVPCNAIMSDADQARLMEMIGDIEDEGLCERLVGKQFVSEGETRFVPDILISGDDFYFPIFSTVEAMGEYGKGFSKVQRHILDVITLARNNEHKPVAIVLNAFSEAFELSSELWDILENMKSRIEG